MSGTSLDGVDGVLADFELPAAPSAARRSATRDDAFPAALRAELLALNAPAPTNCTAPRSPPTRWRALYARRGRDAARRAARASARASRAIGAHGQTVRHRPREFDGTGYTLQLNAPALLAELTGIDVVADFRSRDVAAGGQGAPLVPAFHRPCSAAPARRVGGAQPRRHRQPDRAATRTARSLGFDCGPANVLMDLWCERSTGRSLRCRRRAGRRRARSMPPLLDALLAEPYFALPPPKSTGRDLFNAALARRAARAPTRARGCARRTCRRRSPS